MTSVNFQSSGNVDVAKEQLIMLLIRPRKTGRQSFRTANVSKDRLTTEAINKISTFRGKALRLELVEGDEERTCAFIQVSILKQRVTKYKPIRWI